MRSRRHLGRGVSFGLAAFLVAAYSASAKTTQQSAIPAKIRAALLKDLNYGNHLFEIRPFYDIQVVLTSEERVLHVEGRPIEPGFVNEMVYFAAARGLFEAKCHGGTLCGPRRSYSVQEVSVTLTGKIGSFASKDAYPDLKKLGIPVCLSACET